MYHKDYGKKQRQSIGSMEISRSVPSHINTKHDHPKFQMLVEQEQCSRLKSSMPFKRIWPFQIYLSQNGLSQRNSKSKMKMSLKVLDMICLEQEPTIEGHCHYKK